MKHLAEYAAKVAALDDGQRAALAQSMPVVTIEGHPLSLRNNLLCVMQCAAPVTVVGGFRQWLAHGRCVRKGEHAMYILHPCAPRKPADGEDAGQMYFREAAIFDVSQTDALDLSAMKVDATPAYVAPVQRTAPVRAPAPTEYYSTEFTQL